VGKSPCFRGQVPYTSGVLKWFYNYWLDPEFNRKRKFLQQISFFKNIPRHEFGRLFQALAVRNYQEGEVLFEEGDVGRALFILESGQVEITSDSDGQHHRMAVLGPGGYFGEMSLLDDLPRTATAQALTSCRVYLLYKTELANLLMRAPRVGVAIMSHVAEILAGRLRLTMEPRTPKHVQPFVEEVL
jgi:CRP/FNR family transcriptional regulator, cyclic AMP receptor protein